MVDASVPDIALEPDHTVRKGSIGLLIVTLSEF